MTVVRPALACAIAASALVASCVPAAAAGTTRPPTTTPRPTTTRRPTTARPSVRALSLTRADTGGGDRVTVSGSGFTTPARVSFGGVAGSSVRVRSSRSLTVITPRHAAGTVNVTVSTRRGRSTVTVHDRFTFSAPARCRRVPVAFSGRVTGSETLSPACVSAYLLTGPVVIPAGVTVTLAAGTIVEARSGAAVEVAGALITKGTAGAPVRLTSATDDPASGTAPRAGDWPGITVDPGARASLAGVELQYATTALEVRAGADVVVRGSVLHSTLGIDSPSATVDARHVYWGAADGPSPLGSGTPVSGAGVFATPWTGFAVPPRPAPAPTVDTPPSDTTCADVAFLGARGSGAAPQGAEVADPAVSDRELLSSRLTPIADALTGTLASDGAGLSVRLIGVRYAASGPPFASYSGFSTGYYDAIWAGVDQLEATLAAEHERCPHERVVLAGYSQGALITHLALAELAREGTLGSYRIAAVELVADPARTSTDDDTRLGQAPGTSAGVWTIALAAATALPSVLDPDVDEICHADDPVCDAGVPSGADYLLDAAADGDAHADYPVGDELDQLGRDAARHLERASSAG